MSIGASATKRFARSSMFRYGLPILSKRQKKGGGGVQRPSPWVKGVKKKFPITARRRSRLKFVFWLQIWPSSIPRSGFNRKNHPQTFAPNVNNQNIFLKSQYMIKSILHHSSSGKKYIKKSVYTSANDSFVLLNNWIFFRYIQKYFWVNHVPYYRC